MGNLSQPIGNYNVQLVQNLSVNVTEMLPCSLLPLAFDDLAGVQCREINGSTSGSIFGGLFHDICLLAAGSPLE